MFVASAFFKCHLPVISHSFKIFSVAGNPFHQARIACQRTNYFPVAPMSALDVSHACRDNRTIFFVVLRNKFFKFFTCTVVSTHMHPGPLLGYLCIPHGWNFLAIFSAWHVESSVLQMHLSLTGTISRSLKRIGNQMPKLYNHRRRVDEGLYAWTMPRDIMGDILVSVTTFIDVCRGEFRWSFPRLYLF